MLIVLLPNALLQLLPQCVLLVPQDTGGLMELVLKELLPIVEFTVQLELLAQLAN